MRIKVNLQPVNAVERENLMETLLRHHQMVSNVCNGRGTCGKCKVTITRYAPEPLDIEYQKLSAGELAAGVRLSCQVTACEGMEVVCGPSGNVDRKEVLLYAPKQLNGQYSGVRQVSIDLDLPSLQDERGDWDRLAHKLQERGVVIKPIFSLPILQTLAPLIREQDFAVNVILYNDEVLSVRPGKEIVPLYGVAIDIGTTNIAVALYDLETGSMLKLMAAENGQTRFGADVISRIEFSCKSTNNRELLRQAVLGTINSLISKVCTSVGISSEDIFKAVIVGNTTMHHLFTGLDVSYLALSPFVSVINGSIELTGTESKLEIHPQAKVQLFPNIAGFVGGDTLGAIFGAEELLTSGRHLLIDIGTNCELYLQDGSRSWACSTAAGPAFEGAGITYGMRAQPGAIERVSIDENELEITVIGDAEAIGICGSGLIEAIQQMRQVGVLTEQGRIVDPEDPEVELPPALRCRIREGEKGREFILSYSSRGDDIVLNQRDISQLQYAKGAVCAGIRTLLEIAGIAMEDLDSVVLSGTFAAHLNLASTLDIGLIPQISLKKLKTAGNAAHVGAVKALLDWQAFKNLKLQTSNITHVELGGSPTFSMYFMDSMYIDPCPV